MEDFLEAVRSGLHFMILKLIMQITLIDKSFILVSFDVFIFIVHAFAYIILLLSIMCGINYLKIHARRRSRSGLFNRFCPINACQFLFMAVG